MSVSSTIERPACDVAAPVYTWEQAVDWLRRQPDQTELVRACYYDDPLLDVAQRFADSEEWQAVSALAPSSPGRALDLGAGRGIASYALARDGWDVVALEPDPSPLVGTAAIRSLADAAGLPIEVVQEPAESLPFADRTFDLVYARQVLHHADDLNKLCGEIGRVLKAGGRLIATRDHVISDERDLPAFLSSHPLHRFYHGEHAYRLDKYTAAISAGGLRMTQVLGPWDSVINYFPTTREAWRARCRELLVRLVGAHISNWLTNDQHALGRWTLRQVARHLSRTSDVPGRLYSFVAERVHA